MLAVNSTGSCEEGRRVMKNKKREAGGETVAQENGPGGRVKGMKKKLAIQTENDKENFDAYRAGETAKRDETRSPLPIGYPRVPLQDITAVLRPVNNGNSEEEPVAEMNRRPTWAQNSRIMKASQTPVTSAKIAKMLVAQAGRSKPRNKAPNFAVAKDAATTPQIFGPFERKQAAIHLTVSAVQLEKQIMKEGQVERAHSATEEAYVHIATANASEGLRWGSRIEKNSVGATILLPIIDKEDFPEAGLTAGVGKKNVMIYNEVTEPSPAEKEQRQPDERPQSSSSFCSSLREMGEDSQAWKKRKPLLSARSTVSSFR